MIFKRFPILSFDNKPTMEQKRAIKIFAKGIFIAATIGLTAGICLIRKAKKKSREALDKKALDSTVTIHVHDYERIIVERIDTIHENHT